jgi:hypothetical protein
MRLGASGKDTGNDYDFRAVMGDTEVESGIPASRELSALAEAVCTMDVNRIEAARAAVVEVLGMAALFDASGSIAGFNGYPRAADATGIPLEEFKVAPTADIRDTLGLEAFDLTGKIPD